VTLISVADVTEMSAASSVSGAVFGVAENTDEHEKTFLPSKVNEFTEKHEYVLLSLSGDTTMGPGADRAEAGVSFQQDCTTW
jgi:hypothetical protein